MEDVRLNEKEEKLMHMILDYRSDPTEMADCWKAHFENDEREAREESSIVYEQYRENFYKSVHRLNRDIEYKDNRATA
ncbi:MAG: hypothetical protein Q7S27_03285 [Nanoarchaeota archaeon]|nr:hypothetical protein [Nanoarchaeota archaeon]